MLSRPVALLVALMLVFHASLAVAGPAGTLDRLVADLDARLSEGLGGLDLSEQDLGLQVRTLGGAPDRLGEVVGQLLLARLKARAPRSIALAPRGLDEAGRQAWTGARGLELLLEVDVTLGNGHLHLTGILRRCDRHLWRDVLTPRRGALNHLHASTRIDAEVRAYQGTLSRGGLRLSAETFPVHMGGKVLALASRDLDGDGRAELLVLQRHTLQVFSLLSRQKGMKQVTMIHLGGEAAAIRPRRAMGTLLVVDRDGDRKPEVLLRSSEMAQAEELILTDGKLVSRSHLDGYPLALSGDDLLTCPASSGQDLFSGAGAMVHRAGHEAPIPAAGLPSAFYALRQARGSTAQGLGPIYQGVVDSAGVLALTQAGAPADKVASLKGVGMALHLVDINDDGAMEVITTGGDGPGGKDLLRIHRLKEGKLSAPLWSSGGLPGEVTALGHGDLDGDGKLELVVALGLRSDAVQLMVLR